MIVYEQQAQRKEGVSIIERIRAQLTFDGYSYTVYSFTFHREFGIKEESFSVSSYEQGKEIIDTALKIGGE